MSAETKVAPGQKMAAKVAQGIRRAIIRGEVLEGDFLPSEAELMRSYDVSRPTLREAFRILEAESLIVMHRGARGGAEVRSPQLSVAARYAGNLMQAEQITLADVYEARLIIEPQAARVLAERSTKAIVAALSEVNERQIVAGDDPAGYGRAAADFHVAVVQLTGNVTMSILAELLRVVVERHVEMAVVHRATRTEIHGLDAARHHQRLIDLISEKKAEEAESYWREHLALGTADMLSGIDARTVVDLLG